MSKNIYNCYFQLGQLNDHLFRKDLFIRFAVRVCYGRLSIFVCAYFPFGYESGVWDLVHSFQIIAFPYHLPSIEVAMSKTFWH